jgi:dienelactone hydrolase
MANAADSRVVTPFDLPAHHRPPDQTLRNPTPRRFADRAVTVSEVYFSAEPYLDKPSRAFGYYARPDHLFEPVMPAMLLIHGGGGTAEAQWAVDWAGRGYAALAIDLYGQGPGRQKLPDGGPDWSKDFASFRLDHGLHNTWIHHALANCLRALSLLAVLPDVDANRLGVTGVSWGGFFCASVMCLHDKVKAGIPVFGTGYNPRMARASFIDDRAGEVLRQTYDPSNFFDRCRAQVLWVSTATDRGATLEELLKSHRAVARHTASRLCVHGGPGHTDPRCLGQGEQPTPYLFADSVFRNYPPLAQLAPPQVDGDKLTLTYTSGIPLAIAALHYAHELDKPWTDRAWQAAIADWRTPGRIEATLPPGRPLQAFVSTIDDRGALVSSEPVDVGKVEG